MRFRPVFINPVTFYGLTLKLHSRTIQAHQAHGYIDSQVCFHRGCFSSLSNHERAPQDLWSHRMALIKMCVMPNCSQRLSWPILWIVAVCATYWTHTTAVCLLMVALARLRLLTHPHHPPPTHPPPYTCHL